MSMPRIFLSHSSDDAVFASQLSNDLRSHGADVWLDSSHMAAGDFIARINQALQGRNVVVLVLSPAAIRSTWVTQEFNAAIARSHQGLMRPPLVIMAQPCPLADIPPMWTVYHRYDATQNYQGALNGLLKAFDETAIPQGVPVGTPIAASVNTPPSSAVTYVDALHSNTNGWGTGSRVSFQDDGLHIHNLKSPSNQKAQTWSAGPALDKFGGILSNMTLSVNVSLLQDNDYRGAFIYFRFQDGHFNYCFSLNSNGNWCFGKSQGPGNYVDTIPWAKHQCIRQGLSVTNTLDVRAVGAHFDFYINGVKVGEVDDSTYPSGRFRLGANFDSGAVFSGLVVIAW